MKYQPPVGGGANDPYVDGVVGVSAGSIPPAAAIEDPQREIVNVILGASLTPDENDPTQLLQAIQLLTAYPPGHREGLKLSNNGAAPNTTIDIAAGSARTAANNYNMILAAAMSKVLQASGSWAAGDGANGLFSGAAAANSSYHAFVIRKDDGSIDAGFDTSPIAANRPVNYPNYRRIGAIVTDASANIMAFEQHGKRFEFVTPVLDMNGIALSTVSTPYGLSVPAGIKVRAETFATISGNESGIYPRDPDKADLAPAWPLNLGMGIYSATTSETVSGPLDITTNTSGQIAVRRDSSPVDMWLLTRGWVDFEL